MTCHTENPSWNSLLAVLKDLLAEGSQVIMSAHSPVLVALSGVQILEVGPWGLRQRNWSDLDLISNWRSLDSPERCLRHL
jgi:predicted ATPase